MNRSPRSSSGGRFAFMYFCGRFLQCLFSRTAKLTNGNVSYGTIPKSQWEPPVWIDPKKAEEGREQLSSQGVVHAGESTSHCIHQIIWIGFQEAYRETFVTPP